MANPIYIYNYIRDVLLMPGKHEYDINFILTSRDITQVNCYKICNRKSISQVQCILQYPVKYTYY